MNEICTKITYNVICFKFFLSNVNIIIFLDA